jgi:hypothetical protein
VKPKALIVLLFFLNIGIAGGREVVSFDSGICKFTLHGYELAPHVERAIVFGASRIIDTYKDTFGFSFPDEFKLKITIFADQDEFIEYQKNQRSDGGISKTGYYSGRYSEAVVWKNKDPKTMVGVVFHEASHLTLRHHIPWCPTWINEGLSEYFEGLNVFGEKRRVYLQKNKSDWCKRWAKEGFPIKLDEYLSLSNDEWREFQKKDSKAAYSIGYSLVYFMMSRSSTEKVLKELLWDFKKHGQKANSVQTINNHYPGGFEKFERTWRKWIPRARAYRPLRALRTEAIKAKKDPTADNQTTQKEN